MDDEMGNQNPFVEHPGATEKILNELMRVGDDWSARV